MKQTLFLLAIWFSAVFSYSQNVFKQHGFEKAPLTLSKGRYAEEFTHGEVVRIGTVLLDTRTRKIVEFLEEDTAIIAYKEEVPSRFLTMDPLAEKYPWLSPYAYCMNNPLKYVDPSGLDVYRYDKKTGDLVLAVENDDDFDQIGKFSYDKESGAYTLKTNGSGEAKTYIDCIQKGILSDGINFKTRDQVINVGGTGQASVAGFESFVTAFSDFVEKEINGYYLTNLGGSEINYIGVAHYGNNKWNESRSAFMIQRARPDLIGKIFYHTVYHTHPSMAAEIDKLQASRQDIAAKRNIQEHHPEIKRFIILTRGYLPINY